MSQIQEKKPAKQDKDPLAEIKAAYKTEKAQTATRVVTLKYQSCCGCGCSEIKIKRVVPFDSKLQDGDTADSLLKDDQEA